MTFHERARFEAQAHVLKALAHPTRLFIVEVIAEKPFCVNELTKKIGADMSTVSKHLSVLKNAGLILDEKKGKQVYYSLKMHCVLNFMDCVEAVLKEQAKKSQAVIS